MLNDISGQRFGSLTVTERVGNRHGKPLWRCKHDNGSIWDVGGYRLKSGKTRGKMRRQKASSGNSAKNQVLSNYISRAKLKGIDWSLDDDLFFQLTSCDCHYCGAKPSNMENRNDSQYMYSGIDRVDNSLGYTDGNVVPCCRECNVAKNDRNAEEYLSHIRKIFNHINSLRIN